MAAKKKSAGKSAKKTAPKKASGKKSAAKKKTAPEKKKSAKTKTAPKKAAASTATKVDTPKKKPTASSGAISSSDVNLGHVFALRPRVNTSFRPNDFMAAKRALSDERFTSAAEAARAVAEEALSLTRGDRSNIDPKPRR